MTYTEIAEAAATHFGPKRALSKSAIHAWHQEVKVKHK